MAVPFNIPQDQNEVEVLLVQLQTLLNRLQVAVRRNQQLSQQQQTPVSSTSSIPSGSRVRTSSSNRVRTPESTESDTSASEASQNVYPDLLSNLSWLAASASGTSQSSSPLTAISIGSPRRRSSSESSNCDETKISITAIVKHGYNAQDWNKVGVTLRKIADDFKPSLTNQIDCIDSDESKSIPTDGFLSKIIPASVSSCSLMTAMICFVGWHIFRAR